MHPAGRRAVVLLLLCCSQIGVLSCLSRRRVITRSGRASATPKPLLTADKQGLLSRIANLNRLVQSFTATVDMVPAVGSVYKGQITEYKDVRAYILFRKPADIRIIGLYPVVRNKAFDMASNGRDFQVYLPIKNRFVVGTNEITAPSPNKIENLRPQVFLDTLLVRPVDPGTEYPLLEDLTDEENADYVLQIVRKMENGDLYLARNVWFDRLNLSIVRQQVFDKNGNILTDARYHDWKVFDGVPFPKQIDINRPQDEYGVVITVDKIEMNKSITDDKFVLEQPEGTQVQILGQKPTDTARPAEKPKPAEQAKP